MEIGRTKNSRKVTGIGGYRAQKHAKTAITDADAPTSPTGEPNENSSHRAAPAKPPRNIQIRISAIQSTIRAEFP